MKQTTVVAKMLKPLTVLFIAFVIVCSLITAAAALNMTEVRAHADTLYSLGLFKGAGTDKYGRPMYELSRTPNREEAVTMLVRLLGKEQEALDGNWEIPFTDVSDWAKPYVGYAYSNNLTSGVGETTFGGGTSVAANQYITFVLRAIGYSSTSDFSWEAPWELASKIGLCEEGEYGESNNANFKRANVVALSFNALAIPHKTTGECIGYQIYNAAIASEESYLDFKELMEKACSDRRKSWEKSVNVDELAQYAPNDSKTKGLLTKTEIQRLLRQNPQKTVSYAQAVADVDLYIRSFKYAYPGYYYFGDAVFNKIKANVLADIEGKTTVSAAELDERLREHLSVIQDAHLIRRSPRTYASYYGDDQNFMFDGSRYYKIIDGEKWYYKGCSNEHVTMKPFLTETGALVYTPIWYYYRDCAVGESKITLQCEDKTVVQKVIWKENVPLTSAGLDYKFLKENGIAYISIRSFSGSSSEFNAFLNSAYRVKDAKAIIIDLRANGGGSDGYSRQWIANYSGQTPSPRIRIVSRQTAFYSSVTHGSEYFTKVSSSKGYSIKNDIPIIILTDDQCMSAGEFAVKQLLTLENTIVIGSQTDGRTFCCGGFLRLSLPNSGVRYTMGTALYFLDDNQNRDDMGIEPDIWCNPTTSLDSVLMMLMRNGTIDSKAAWEMTQKLDKPAE